MMTRIRRTVLSVVMLLTLASCAQRLEGPLEGGNRSVDQPPATIVVERIIVERVITATPDPDADSDAQTGDQGGQSGSQGGNSEQANATETPAVCADGDSDEVNVYAAGFLSGGRMLITVQRDGGFEEGEYELAVEGSKYACTQLGQYPDRLYCVGNQRPASEAITIYLQPVAGGCPRYSMQFRMPVTPTSEAAIKKPSAPRPYYP